MTPKNQLDSYPAFDWLRIFLSLTVVVVHSDVAKYQLGAELAVQVFFALSGYLIGGLLLKTDLSDVPHFYFNRVLRVWLPYYFALFLIYVISFSKDPINQHIFATLFYDITFSHFNFVSKYLSAESSKFLPLSGASNHFWSISIEEQFYVAAPAFILASKYAKIRPRALFIVPSAIIAFSGTQFASISIGFLSAIVAEMYPAWHLKRTPKFFIATTALILFLSLNISNRLHEYFYPILSICLVMICAVPGDRTRLGKFFGGISYPVYLNHGIAMRLIDRVALAAGLELSTAEGVLRIIAGVAAGTAAYMLIDKRIMAKRQTLYTPGRGKTLTIVACSLSALGIGVGLWRKSAGLW
jgi:peptidoglycan/LPS O-acetylase OafA/YrhL